MKASLIINLVTAHNAKNENSFNQALAALIEDEEKKGNSSLALQLRNAYKKKVDVSFFNSPKSNMGVTMQSVTAVPKDKDSTLDLLEVIQPAITLKDVALSSEEYMALQQVISEQKRAAELMEKGIVPTHRVLFCGPPGCGKTLTANALAGELSLPLVYVKLDGLVSSYLGQTGANIRKIFEYVKDKRVVLFLDEFDAIAKKRDDSHELGELKRVVTTLLQNLDEMQANIFLIAATNHQHLLDPAIWRRFEVTIMMELPTQEQREKIILSSIQKFFSDFKIDLSLLISLTEGMNGAQIVNFMQFMAKYFVINNQQEKNIQPEVISKLWLKNVTLSTGEDNNSLNNALRKLQKAGVTIRVLQQITGIPKSTISYRLKSLEVDHGN